MFRSQSELVPAKTISEANGSTKPTSHSVSLKLADLVTNLKKTDIFREKITINADQFKEYMDKLNHRCEIIQGLLLTKPVNYFKMSEQAQEMYAYLIKLRDLKSTARQEKVMLGSVCAMVDKSLNPLIDSINVQLTVSEERLNFLQQAEMVIQDQQKALVLHPQLRALLDKTMGEIRVLSGKSKSCFLLHSMPDSMLSRPDNWVIKFVESLRRDIQFSDLKIKSQATDLSAGMNFNIFFKDNISYADSIIVLLTPSLCASFRGDSNNICDVTQIAFMNEKIKYEAVIENKCAYVHEICGIVQKDIYVKLQQGFNTPADWRDSGYLHGLKNMIADILFNQSPPAAYATIWESFFIQANQYITTLTMREQEILIPLFTNSLLCVSLQAKACPEENSQLASLAAMANKW